MSEKSLRIALVGAGTLLGKALSDELALSAFASADIRLLDDDEDAQGVGGHPVSLVAFENGAKSHAQSLGHWGGE